MSRTVPFLLLLLVTSAPQPGMATPDRTGASVRPRLSMAARLALRWWQTGRPLPLPGRQALAGASRALVTLQFATAPTNQRLQELSALGLGFWHHEGRIVRRGTLVPARVPFDLLEVIEFWPEVDRVELRLQPPRPELIENAPAMTELPQTRATFDGAGLPLTGQGVTVGVIDSWVDLFHPWFFRPDGPRLDWVDVDDNGLFEPGIDGTDWNQDGLISDTEVLQLLKGTVQWDGFNEGEMVVEVENDGTELFPALDWLWLDENSSGVREYGPKHGYKEYTPAYGEPLFVVDDVDGNGSLDPGEKLVGLRTSKLKSILFMFPEQSFTRGVNLIDYPAPYVERSHATMTLGVLAGGAHPYQPFAGVAPDVDILLVDTTQGALPPEGGDYGGSYLASSMALADAGADVLMHEYGWPLFEFGDGTSLLETGLDALAEENGILSCTAAHNFAGYEMHAQVTVPAGGDVVFPFETNKFGEDYPTELLYITLRHRGNDHNLTFTVLGENGLQVEVGEEELEWVGQGSAVWSSGPELSPRGTYMVSMVISADSYYDPLPGNMWKLVVHNNGGEDRFIDLFAGDQTGYLYTADLTEYTTKVGTMAHPSTADSVLSVGAYRANVDSWAGQVEVGDLAYYSGRGPRIDGERGLDIVGPSDLLAAWWSEEVLYYPAFRYAAGTSGSLPQATGVVALLLQAKPDLLPAEIKQRVLDGAVRDQFTGPDINPTWGAGKLSAYRTIFGEEPPGNTPPEAFVVGPTEVRLQEPFLLDASGSTDDGPQGDLEVRWDLNYDGAFDIPYRSELTLAVEAAYEPGPLVVLAEVRDGYGWSDRGLVRIVVLDEVFQPPAAEPEPEGEIRTAEDASSAADISPAPPDLRGGCNTSSTGSNAVPRLLLITLLLVALCRGRKVCNRPESMTE